MRTLLLSPEMFGGEGGVSRMMRLYLKALCETAAEGDEVTSVSLNDQPETDPRLANYSTAALRSHTGCARRKATFIRESLRAARSSHRIVCGHLHQLPVAWMAQKFNRRIDYYLVAHGVEVWRPYSSIERRALRDARGIFCVSAYTRSRVFEQMPELAPEKLVVLPNTLDPHLEGAALDSAGGAATKVARRAPSDLRILSVGRLRRIDAAKGFETTIEAMPLIRREFAAAALRIVGGGDDLERLQARAEELGVKEACTFTGKISDEALAAEYNACDLFALPSNKEGFGLVYLEAMIRGKPCIGASAGGVPEVVNECVGALVDYGDPAAIARAVADLAHHPRDPATIRAHARTFAFPAFKERLVAALK